MNKDLIINPDTSYSLAEQKAAQYYQSLYTQVLQKTYITALTKDIQSWKHNHIHSYFGLSFFNRGKGKTVPKGYHNYIQWLEYTGKLDNYLYRSTSYIYMRDLGKALDTPDTKKRVRQVVDHIKVHLKTFKGDKNQDFSLSGLYRFGKKEHIETTMIWVINKLKTVSTHIPESLNPEHAQRKLIKIIAGVLINVMEEMGPNVKGEERIERLDRAIRLGYSYGLTYPFIDDLLDADILSAEEKKQFSNLIRTTLFTGTVPELGEWAEKNLDFIRFVHSELKEAFEYIKANQRWDSVKSLLEQAFVFFNSQEVDRIKDLSNGNYKNEDLYIPIILKSSSSRLIVRSVLDAPEDEGFNNRTFYYGIYNQLADDFTDMFEDLKDGAVTPYTYYITYHDKRPDLINPFELYWTVISHLIHNVFHSDSLTCEVILDRAFNSLKRFKERMGTEKYNEVMELFSTSKAFNKVIQNMVRKVDDVDFFDKLLRDHVISILKDERKERENFFQIIENGREQINEILKISDTHHDPLLREPIIDAANYSLEGDGKRLRPIITWVMGVNGYGLNRSAIIPLLRSLEYMHTASLIFDDLPSQDNAPIRRGRPTLHQVYNVAIAELTGLFLTQKATEEQASLQGFDPKAVLNLIHYSAQITEVMCRGQVLDLDSKGKLLTLEQLNTMCFYKTGIAFEASLVMPAILASAKEIEIQALKRFARHAGIAFQIKDDLLDLEGDVKILGKPVGKDAENHNATFVSILGEEGAKKEMWEHYCSAMEALQDLHRNTPFLKHLLNYFVNRNH